jgi:small subunit ribosomal protein S6
MQMPQVQTNYEALVILSAQLDDTAREELIEKLRKLLEGAGMQIREVALWGRRRLAYPINKRNDGYYVIFYFTGKETTEVFEVFDRTCRYDENIYRQMILKVPLRKKGQEIAQLVPSPGWKADFRLEARMMAPRRRPDGPRHAPAEAGSAVAEAVGGDEAPEGEVEPAGDDKE